MTTHRTPTRGDAPPPARVAHRRRRWRVGLVVTVAVTSLLAAAAPLERGPRPDQPAGRPAAIDVYAPPVTVEAGAFTTLPHEDVRLPSGTWTISADRLPLTFVAEQEVVDTYGLDAVTAAIRQWNGVPGSRFAADVVATTDAGVTHRQRDGVSRIFFDDATCGDRYLARAHLYPAAVSPAEGRSTAYVTEVDVGLCRRLDAPRLGNVVRHELLHAAGVGHLTDPADHCRVMFPQADPCQDRAPGDDLSLVHLHPTVRRLAPAATGDTALAAVSRLLFPRTGSAPVVVLVPATAPAHLQAAAVMLADRQNAPLLAVAADCTSGPVGRELNRVASAHAKVLLVGGVDPACRHQLAAGWELDLRELPTVIELALHLLELGARPETLVLVPDDDGAWSEAAIAPGLAATRDAVVLPIGPDGIDDALAGYLDEQPVKQVFVLAGPGRVDDDVLDALRDRLPFGRVRRIAATDRVGTALRLAGSWDVFGLADLDIVLTGDASPAAGIAAAVLAARAGAVVLLSPAAGLDPRVETFLRTRVRAATITGGIDVLSAATQSAASIATR